MDELIVTGYCKVLDGSRVLCCEEDEGEWTTDCVYPHCEFAGTCRVLENAREKLGDSTAFPTGTGKG